MKWHRIEIKGVALAVLILFPIISVLFVYFGLRFRQEVRGHLKPKGEVAQFFPKQWKQLSKTSIDPQGHYNVWAFQRSPKDTLLLATLRRVVLTFHTNPHVLIIHWTSDSSYCMDFDPPYRCMTTADSIVLNDPTLVLIDTSAQLVSTYTLIDSAAMLQVLRDLAVFIPPEK